MEVLKKQKITKFCLIILLNAIIILISWLSLEYFAYKSFYKQWIEWNLKEVEEKSIQFHFFDSDNINDLTYINNKKQGSRPPSGLEYKKKPIILFGCSFTQGTRLDDQQTFSHKLSQYTKRPVYNYGFGGKGIQHMLYILQKGEIFEQIKEPPEYVIYTFIPDHIYRLHRYVFLPILDFHPYLHYDIKNGEFKETKWHKPLTHSYLAKAFLRKLSDTNLSSNKNNENFNILKLYFEESKKLVNQKYPNTKFVILLYPEAFKPNNWFLETKRWEELQRNDFTVIYAQDLTNENLTQSEYVFEDMHPTEKAWDLLVPAIVRKLETE